MILAVAPNTALDRVIFVRDFQWGHTFRAEQAICCPGSKAGDAAVVLAELGQDCLLTGLAAGESGKQMQRLVEARGVRTDLVPCDGETRTVIVLIDTACGLQSTISASGLLPRPEHVAALDARMEHWLPQARALVLGGGVPEGMPSDWYVPWIRRARTQGLPVLLDASGEVLARSAPAGPTVLKPNLDELAALVGRRLTSRTEVLAAARELLDWGILTTQSGDAGRGRAQTSAEKRTDPRPSASIRVQSPAQPEQSWGIDLVLATLGAEGALAVLRERAYYLPPIPVEPVNCAGAGDAMVASLATAYAQGWPVEEGLRLAVAAATAVVITPGTAECHREDVERFLPQVRMEEIEG